ncbi:PAS domain S-box protein [Mariniflexile ostreae]|uniref:histidine kinase n=1 Tax=Mariniflexile ostreae TaxID=1520892 RepID=A0ABV5FF78_9FLAO
MPTVNKNSLPSNSTSESIDLFSIIQEAATIGIWEFNIDNNVLYWSPMTKKIHEVEQEYEPQIESALNFYKEGYSRETIKDLYKKCIENFEPYDTELKIITALGKEKWVRVIGTVDIRNNKVYRVCGAFQDITEKTLANRKIALSEERFRKTFEYSKTGVALMNLDGNWLKINKHLCDLLGYDENDLKKTPYKTLIHKEDYTKHKAKFSDFINGKIASYTVQKRLVNKTGTPIWAIITKSLIKNNKGIPTHYVLHVEDINDSKTAELKIRALLDISEKQNKQLLNFAHIVSHNLRSHYSNLEMICSVIELEEPNFVETDNFSIIKTAIGKLGDTIHNLNDSINLKSKVLKNLKPVNLKDAIDNAILNIRQFAKTHNAIIHIAVDDSIKITTVPSYIHSIFHNLLTNAIKYKSPNRQLLINISATIEGKYVIITFKDNGIGINLDLHGEKIFGMYKTFHNQDNSNGLGLYITKNQVEALDGDIKVESEVNVGTIFTITLMNE